MSYAVEEKAAEIADEINAIGLDITVNYRLSDAIREGSKFTEQAVGGWGDASHNACAMTSAFTAAKARGFLE